MKWHNLRHVLYLKSSDFMAMLSVIHMLKLVLVGFGVIRNAHDIQDIQSQAWALITSTVVFTICLAGSRRGYAAITTADASKESDGNTEPGEKTYSRFHRFFIPIALFISLVDLITMSAYHGIITVLALHLVLISFSLTGFPCIIILALNITGVVFGTGFHLILVRRLYSDVEGTLGHHPAIGGPMSFHGLTHNTAGHWSHAQNRLTELATSYGYGLATKTSIVLLDMGLLLVHIVGGLAFYSRFWKLGVLMAKHKANPSHYVQDFPLLLKLEQVIFNAFAGVFSGASVGTGVYEEDQVAPALGKKVVGSAVHGRAPGEGGELHSNPGSKDNTPKNNENMMDDELEDAEWLKFLEKNESVKTFGRRTYSTEPIQLNYLPPSTLADAYPDIGCIDKFDSDFYDGDLNSMGTLSSLYGSRFGTLTSANLGSRLGSRFGSRMTSTSKLTSKVDTVSTNLPLSTTTTFSEDSGGSIAERLLHEGGEGLPVSSYTGTDNVSKAHGSPKSSTIVRFNTKPFTTIPPEPVYRDRSDVNSVEGEIEPEKELVERKVRVESSSVHLRALNSALKEDKLMNITVEFYNPFTKFIYLLMPNWAKKIMKKSVLSSNSLKKKREMVHNLRWSGPRSLPHVNALQLFSYEQYEWLYVKWMHSFNRHFYNSTVFEMIAIIFYSSAGTILLGYRHYLTLSESDKELYICKTSRLVTMAVRFILYPIISLILIIMVGYILLNHVTPSTAGDATVVGDRAGKSANAIIGAAVNSEHPSAKGDVNSLKKARKERKNKMRGNERIIWVYWLMLLLCLVDFVGSMFDVFVSLGLETPPYAVHNSLVMQFLMTKTAAFLLLRFPTLFVLYLIYFVGLFTAQFFLKHTNTFRFITMQVSCQLIIGVGSWSFLIRPVDLNRRRVFSEVILPYVLYLSNFLR